MKIEEGMNNQGLNPHFIESSIDGLRNDISQHLALVLSGGYRFIPDMYEELSISEQGVLYSDLEGQKLSTPQVVVILLEVADFLFQNRNTPNIHILKNTIIEFPYSYSRVVGDGIEKGDLFHQVPASHGIYCLSKAFMLLRAKLFERQTGLYHALFLKTILMLDREQVPPQFLLGNEFSDISWLSITKRYLIPDNNIEKGIRIDIEGLKDYPRLWKEIEELYFNSFITGMSTNMLLKRIG